MSTFSKAKSRTRKALIQAGVGWAIGGCDISINEEGGRGFWQPHTVIFAPDSIRDRAPSREFRTPFRKTRRVPRPVRMQRFDGMLTGIAYAVKTDFVRRETLPKVIDAEGSTTRRRNTRDRPMRARQKVELMVALDRAGLLARVFCLEVEIHADGKWPAFRLSAPP